jgi:tRNA A-37 threonylcarbamoyl transferase component Bud32
MSFRVNLMLTPSKVWRVRDSKGECFVVKHAEPYVKNAPEISFPVSRMDFEARVMEKIPELLPDATHVTVPRVIRYDNASSVLMMSDGGEKTLKAVYLLSTAEDARVLGSRAGKWLRSLHSATVDVDIGKWCSLLQFYLSANGYSFVSAFTRSS